MKLRLILLVFLFIPIASVSLIAGGTDYNPLVGGKTLSLNGLYFAGTDGLASIISNPAGLGYVNGLNLEISGIDRLGLHQFENSQMGLYRSYRNDDISFSAGAYWKLSPAITVAAYYGRVYDYFVNFPFALLGADNSTVLAFDMSNHFKVNSISPALSLKLGNTTIGLAVNFYNVMQETAFPQKNPDFFSGKGLYAYQFHYKQKAWTYGFNIGVITDLSKDLRLGVDLKSGFKANLSGTANSLMFNAVDSTSSIQPALSSTFQMPWIIGAGVIYNLPQGVKLNVDVQYSLYGSLQNNMNFKFSDQRWQNGLTREDSISGINGSRFPLQYNNKFDFGVGIDLPLDNQTHLRAAYRFSQSPNSNNTYSFIFPDVNEHSLSIGLGFKDGPYTLNAGLTYSYGVSKNVTDSSMPKFSGKYSSDGYYPTITLRYSIF